MSWVCAMVEQEIVAEVVAVVVVVAVKVELAWMLTVVDSVELVAEKGALEMVCHCKSRKNNN